MDVCERKKDDLFLTVLPTCYNWLNNQCYKYKRSKNFKKITISMLNSKRAQKKTKDKADYEYFLKIYIISLLSLIILTALIVLIIYVWVTINIQIKSNYQTENYVTRKEFINWAQNIQRTLEEHIKKIDNEKKKLTEEAEKKRLAKEAEKKILAEEAEKNHFNKEAKKKKIEEFMKAIQVTLMK